MGTDQVFHLHSPPLSISHCPLNATLSPLSGILNLLLRSIRFIIMANLWCDLFGLPAAFPIQKSSLLSVCLFALLSLPLSLFYFSRFPLLFFPIFMAHSFDKGRCTKAIPNPNPKLEERSWNPSLSLRQKTSSNGSSSKQGNGGVAAVRNGWQRHHKTQPSKRQN